jgi:hypothetical protein
LILAEIRDRHGFCSRNRRGAARVSPQEVLMNRLSRMLSIAAASAALMSAPAAHAALIVVDTSYDLGSSALHVNYDAVNGLDWYTSLPIALGSQTVAAGDQLRVNVVFRDATTMAGQTILLDQMGLGGATAAPSTFGSPSSTAGGHLFGPSLTLFGSASLQGASITPSVALGTLAGDYTGNAASTSCLLGACDYGVIFPDLIDGMAMIGLSGFSVLFGTTGSGAGSISDLQFNLIAPTITVVSQAVPEPGALALAALALAAAGMARARRPHA